MIIRHAEKPKRAWPGPGFTIKGLEDDKSLVIRGWQRAGAWAALFSEGRGGEDYPQPRVIYAADPDAPVPTGIEADDDEAPSQRPYETVKPLAKRLGLSIDDRIAQGNENGLADALVKETGVVLLAWEHKAIVKPLLGLIANGQPGLALPTDWPGERFDVVLRFDRDDAGKPWRFRQLFPKLLSGDSDTPLPT
jgi:hypothetical protein